MSRLEGQLIGDKHIAKLKARFEHLHPSLQKTIREIADDAGNISLNPPTERRVGIARILLEIAEQDGHIDKDLVRSLCEIRTGKQYLSAGAGLSDLSWIDAERVWSLLLDIYSDRVTLEYNPASNNYHINKENTHV